MCSPQPVQVGLPQAEQVIRAHIMRVLSDDVLDGLVDLSRFQEAGYVPRSAICRRTSSISRSRAPWMSWSSCAGGRTPGWA